MEEENYPLSQSLKALFKLNKIAGSISRTTEPIRLFYINK